MKYGKAAAMAGCVIAIVALVKLNGPFNDYIQAMRNTGSHSSPAYSDQTNERLLQDIRNEAEKRKVKPIDARVDRVWKAIPGYNGLEVDIDRTYAANVSNDAGAPLKLIYKEVPPAVSLNDLGAQEVYRGNPNKKMVSFMINVAWGNEFIEPILKTLEQENVKATFFLDGSWLRNNPDLAKKIQTAGHELSNHAYNHPNMRNLSRDAQYQQITKTEGLLKSVLDVDDNRWFAPPSGSYNSLTVSLAHSLGLRTVLWTIDTIDWQKPPASVVVSRIRSKLQPGALILMHPTASTRDALADLIKLIKSKGYQLGTVSDTLSPNRTDTGG